MTDLKKAIQYLNENSCTCVLVKGEKIYSSTKKGIAPMLDFIQSGVDLRGFSACDLIVGKAVAMLFSYAGVKAVHAKILSKSGADYLNKRYVPYTFDVLTENIINRAGDGICPMEKIVESVEDEETAVYLLKEKLKQLKYQ